MTAQPFSFEALLTIRTITASGTIIGECQVLGDEVTTGLFTALVDLSATVATVAVDSTVANLLELTFQSGTAGSSCTFHAATIESLTAGGGGGGGGVSTVDQDISADFVSASDSAWHDITGLTGIVLAAGTWIGLIDLEILCGTSYGAPVRVWDGTTTYAQAELFYSSPVTAISSHWHFATKPLVLGSSTTMAIAIFSDTVVTVKKYPSRGGLSSAIATHVTFLKIA